MASALKELSPSIQLGDKVVKVGVMSWGDFKAVVNVFTQANLPMPILDGGRISTCFADIQGYISSAKGQDASAVQFATIQANVKIKELVATLVSENLEVLKDWALGCSPLVSAFVKGACNLTVEEVDQLTAGQLLRVARAAWKALVDDGFFTEAAGFFGELVGLTRQPSPPANQPTNQNGTEAANGQALPNAST